MTLSFILTSSDTTNDKLEVTLKSILKQNSKNYEIIIIDDGTSSDNLLTINKYFRDNSDAIKVITTWKEISTSTCWNLGLHNAKGAYVLFLQAGYQLLDNFINDITQEIQEQSEPDLIEFIVQYSNVYNHTSSRLLKEKHLYHPLLNREVFALIHHSLFNKLFKRKTITSHRIAFRENSRFDLLFIYNLLPWIETFYTSHKVLIDVEILPAINFNSFDFLKQWVHIYNYYRNINLAKELREELEYAFVRFHYYTFLRIIKPTANKVLIKKAIKEVTKKVNRRFPLWQQNSYLNLVSNDEFSRIVSNKLKIYWKTFV